MTDVHLICGPVGAGKTTYALRLCDERGAAHLSIDDWMVTLFGPDAPVPPDWGFVAPRVARCERQIVTTAAEVGRRGLATILDLGFLRADQRARVAETVLAAGLTPRLHWIDVPAEERWRRVSGRNEAGGETYRLAVTRPMFDHVDALFEPPSPEEMARLHGVRVAGAAPA